VISAAILNGGRAVRFGGRDKGGLVAGGRAIRERQLDLLSRLSDDVLIVGGVAPQVPETVRLVADREPGRGPLAGIEAALSHARHDTILVVACDMPGLTAPFLGALVAWSVNTDAVVPRTESGYHPLCAVYRRTCLPAVERLLAEGRLAVRGLFALVRVHEVDGVALRAFGDPARLLANVNTPAEYDALEGLLNHEL
jgi:molybdopterin-guanine dinucleotide biosynthesis protein A